MLVGGYTFYNTHWPNVPTVRDTANDINGGNGGAIGGGQVVSNSNDLGGETLLLRRRLSDSTTAHGKFLHILLYTLLFER